MRSTFKVLFYLKRNKEKTQSAVPVMGRITVIIGISATGKAM